MKSALFWFSCLLMTVVALLSVAELLMRLAEPMSPYAPDDEIGWVNSANYEFHGSKRDIAGAEYQVDIRTEDNGFNVFGDPRETDTLKAFFVGDSITQALQVSSDKTYYSVIGDLLPLEIFAYGSDGYGTLQEFLILDRFIDDIRPDIIVIQASWTDVLNNHYPLDRLSTLTDMGRRRPYLTENGDIVYALPSRFPRVRQAVNDYSRLLTALWLLSERLLPPTVTQSIESTLATEGFSYPPFRDGVAITNQIFGKVRSRAAGIPVFVFCSDLAAAGDFRAIAERNGGNFIDGVPQALRAAQERGEVIAAADGSHWNERGHRITAEVISQHLARSLDTIRGAAQVGSVGQDGQPPAVVVALRSARAAARDLDAYRH